MSPHKFVFMACVASQVCFHGVCRLLSLFPWRVSLSKFGFHGRVSPYKFVSMACVASQVCFHGVCRLTSLFSFFFFVQVCFHGVCRLTSLFSWRVSPYKFVSMACVAFNLVFMACVAV